ncbi:MAG: Uma2 family endonuclease [Cytophagales bacterium]
MSAQAITHYSIEDYLHREREASEKSEYFKGEIFMMAGASFAHNRMNENLSIRVGTFLEGKSCQSFSRDFRIHIPENTLFTYPDLVVVCGEPALFDEEEDTVLNPTIIVEILSASTASYDRGEKFALYREITTLKEYVLIDSTKVWAEVWSKNKEGLWTLAQELKRIDDKIYFNAIGFTLSLADVYKNSKIEAK